MNIVVPIGEVTFVLFDDRENSNSINNLFPITLFLSNYFRLTILPGVWHAFKSNLDVNLILDVASIEHMPDKIIRNDLDAIPFDWSSL